MPGTGDPLPVSVKDVKRVVEKRFEEYGTPRFLRSDNGGEFLARTLVVFLSARDTKPYFIKPGSPWQNGFIESFNSRLRAECLDVELFHNLADAGIKLAVYRRSYNEERPHSSIGYVAAATYGACCRNAGRATPSLHSGSEMSQPTADSS